MVLHNIKYTCPSFAIVLVNIYRVPARLFVTGGKELLSEEGTTQGCPLSMTTYALSVVPLINKCHEGLLEAPARVTQMLFANDTAACGKKEALQQFWDLHFMDLHAYGYFPKPSKTYIVMKLECRVEIECLFEDTGVHLTGYWEGLVHKAAQCHLGAVLLNLSVYT